MDKLQDWQRANVSWSFRIYRTAGGLRLLAISGLKAAGSAEANGWLEAVGSDPLYLRLCRDQKSFRARLTPKPWRCGVKQLPIRYPWTQPPEQKAFDQWLCNYQAKCGNFSVCDYVETLGFDSPSADVRPVLALHDERTGVGTGRPLA